LVDFINSILVGVVVTIITYYITKHFDENLDSPWSKIVIIGILIVSVFITHRIIAGVEKIEILGGDRTYSVGQSEILKCSVPSNIDDIYWSSSDQTVASISPDGEVSTFGAGTARITASSDGGRQKDTIVIKVTDSRTISQKLILNKSQTTLYVGETVTLEPIAYEEEVNWESSRENVAVVSSNGEVEALSPGEVTITVRAKSDDSLKDTCYVTILKRDTSSQSDNTEIKVSEIVLNTKQLNLNVQESDILEARVIPSNASNKSVDWSSDNIDIVTVSSNGKLTALKSGTAIITARAKDGSKVLEQCKVIVNQPVKSVSLDEEGLELFCGDSAILTETVYPMDADNKSVSWHSSNECVTVNNGRISAIKEGSAQITVVTKDGNYTDSCSVTVKPVVIQVNKSSTTLYVGESEPLTVTTIPSHLGDDVKWSTENDKVAVVDKTGKITAVSAGSTKITATLNNGKNAVCNITVKPLTRAIHLSAGQYGSFGTDLNNAYNGGDRLTSYLFEFITGNSALENTYLFKYYSPNTGTTSGMSIYLNSASKLVLHMDYLGSNGRYECANMMFQKNTKYTVSITIKHEKTYRPTITINGQKQDTNYTGITGWSCNSGTKFLGSDKSTQSGDFYVTRLHIAGSPSGNINSLETFSVNLSELSKGQTTISNGGVTLKLFGTTVNDYNLP